MLISHVQKELSHSDWLFVCKLKVGDSTLSKIQLAQTFDDVKVHKKL